MRPYWLWLCVVAGCGGPNPGSPPGSPGGSQDQDFLQYDQLQAKLDGYRTPFLGKEAVELDGQGNQVYWKTFQTFAPQLHRRDDTSTVDYAFSIGSGDSYNYRASGSVVVTAQPNGDKVTYRAFDAISVNTPLGTADFPSPMGAKWWAYSVSQNDVYVVTTVAGMASTLYRWTPTAGGPPTQVTTLESATHTQIGELDDFAVDGNTMIFIEAGRIWKLDIAANQATWLMNKIQVSTGAQFSSDGVIFSTDADQLLFFSYAEQQLHDLGNEIATSSYQLNDTFKTAHEFSQDYARWRDWVIYGSHNDGMFGYNLSTHAVAPVLLPPRDGMTRIVYRYPVTLDDGTLLVVGLMSTDGAVGADGPVFRVSLPSAFSGSAR